MNAHHWWTIAKLVVGWFGFALFFAWIFGSFMNSLCEEDDDES